MIDKKSLCLGCEKYNKDLDKIPPCKLSKIKSSEEENYTKKEDYYECNLYPQKINRYNIDSLIQNKILISFYNMRDTNANLDFNAIIAYLKLSFEDTHINDIIDILLNLEDKRKEKEGNGNE